ncbi:uncharacterized protein IUM83_04524 [Phytophthora cinnamomi]|uniref:uncharacterized protein n=1 Tax=Phytophthora cinnamomi TaxID=4785 RepID=UPI00355A9FED|nr:hypothetical protein IUM83_04524 [Phytophthora cinnamomi]
MRFGQSHGIIQPCAVPLDEVLKMHEGIRHNRISPVEMESEKVISGASSANSPLPLSASMAKVHTAWLTAGANGDAAAMRELWSRFPEWLAFNRQVGRAKSDSLSQRQAKFCSWGDFHLRTIGASALHTASWGGNLGIVEFLLESGQDPNVGDDSSMTAMMVAILRLNLMTMRCVFRDGVAARRNTVVDCRQEQDEQVQRVLDVMALLLRFGAQVDARSQDGKTALHCSTSDDAYDVAKFLLDAGAEIDTLDESGKTPLHYCVQEGGLLVTDLLLSCGASIDVEDKDGTSSLALVLQRGNVNVLQLFLNHHQCVAAPKRHDFAAAVLLQAVEFRAEEMVRYVVENERQSDRGHCELRDTSTLCCSELGAANLLNVVNGQGLSSLYIAGTTPFHYDYPRLEDEVGNERMVSVTIRDAKVQLLLEHGARLFTHVFLETELELEDSLSRVKLPAQVQQCLRTWIVEDGTPVDEPEDDETVHTSDGSDLTEAVAELCMQWVASVACVGSWPSLIPVVICAGYAHDVVPLLVELPLQRWTLPALLHQLEKFARHQLCHALLLELHNELLEACQAATTPNVST